MKYKHSIIRPFLNDRSGLGLLQKVIANLPVNQKHSGFALPVPEFPFQILVKKNKVGIICISFLAWKLSHLHYCKTTSKLYSISITMFPLTILI